MNKYRAVFGPQYNDRNLGIAMLYGDRSRIRPGKRLKSPDGNVLVISSVGTHCGGYQPNQAHVLLNGKIDRTITEYTLID